MRNTLCKIAFLLLLTLGSCAQPNRFVHFYTVENEVWQSDKSFNFQLRNSEDLDSLCNIFIVLRHNGAVDKKLIELNLEILSPKGVLFNRDFSITLPRSSRDGQFSQVEFKAVANGLLSEKGVYNFKIKEKNNTSIDGISEVGLVIKNIGEL